MTKTSRCQKGEKGMMQELILSSLQLPYQVLRQKNEAEHPEWPEYLFWYSDLSSLQSLADFTYWLTKNYVDVSYYYLDGVRLPGTKQHISFADWLDVKDFVYIPAKHPDIAAITYVLDAITRSQLWDFYEKDTLETKEEP